MPAEVERLAEGDRNRMEVAELPVLRPVNRTADDRYLLLDGDHRGTAAHGPGLTLLTRPLREHAERVTSPHDLAHDPNRLAVRLAAAHRRRPEEADERPDDWIVVGLLLRD